MATYTTLASLFSAIADAIRAKTGSSADIVADDFPDEIAAIPSGGGTSKNVQAYMGYATSRTTALSATAVTLTVAKAGTYNISWMGYRSYNGNTFGSRLYKNESAIGTESTSFVNTYGQYVSLTNQSLAKDDVLTVYARANSTSRYMGVGNLVIQEV